MPYPTDALATARLVATNFDKFTSLSEEDQLRLRADAWRDLKAAHLANRLHPVRPHRCTFCRAAPGRGMLHER